MKQNSIKKFLKTLFSIEKKPRKGLLLMEWAVLLYSLLTLAYILFTITKLPYAEAMMWERVRVIAMMGALWLVYRLLPCRFTLLCRVVVQMALLARWYPETYELNRISPNLDHIFASWEQALFGSQPSLWFSQMWSSPVISELMDMGYAAYYPMIALVTFYYFLARYSDFARCAFVIMASFFAYYLIYILIPVTGPTFYFHAIGIDKAAAGIFPDVHNYFATHTGCLPSPGYPDGIFHSLVDSAKAAGERPTAAFPSSHVGVSTICMLLVWMSDNRKLLLGMLPFYIFLCMATVYIQAHYAIDVLAGWVTGVAFFFLFWNIKEPKGK